MKHAEIVASGGVIGTQPPPRLELLPVELKLDEPTTYLSWSRWIIDGLAGRSLDGYLTGEEKEPPVLLNSMVPSIITTVSVKEI